MYRMLLVFSLLLGGFANSLLAGEARVIWTGKHIFSWTISPNGKCLAFQEFGFPGVWVMNPTEKNPTPHQITFPPPAGNIDSMQCLNNGLWVDYGSDGQTFRYSEIYHIDLETFEVRLVLRENDNLELSGLTVDSFDPSRIFVVTRTSIPGSFFDTSGLYQLEKDGTLTLVANPEESGIRFLSSKFWISGNRALFFGNYKGDPVDMESRLFQLNLETLLLEPLFTVGQRRSDGRFFTPHFRSAGKLAVITTSTTPEARPTNGAISHALYLLPGEILPLDAFTRVGALSEVMAMPVVQALPEAYFRTSIELLGGGVWSVGGGMWGATVTRTSGFSGNKFAAWVDGKKIIEAGDPLSKKLGFEFLGSFLSTRDEVVGTVQNRLPDGGFESGILFLPIGPSGPPCVSPKFSSDGVVNAASFEAGPLVPEMWTTIVGDCLAPPDGGKARVLVNGQEIEPIFVSKTQVNFLTPDNLPTSGSVKVAVVLYDSNGQELKRSEEVEVQTAENFPGLFTSQGIPIVTDNRTFGIVTEGNPLPQGGVFNLWFTGLDPQASVEVTIGKAIFKGRVMLGLTQVNIELLPGLKGGRVEGQLTVLGKTFDFVLFLEE